ncbi:hypothetical protein J2X31_002574 [Flavobacterium arsenatis]|uniref:Ig-like domain-containing protein n=1 Tax=Flavobacterium arsenatis TaxID=1484332 RepID=A0ABU1TRP2_9FLAO|nr:MopE-related protein [Flavobacterium arsenatis]MDR6968551.1 hypothetical protein [Flavobacterium arsenatis]
MNKRLHSFFKVILLMALLNTGFDMSGQKLYWNKNNPTKIESINFDGTALNTHYAATGFASWHGLEVDLTNQKMYWYDQLQTSFMKANLDGTNATILVTDVYSITGMSIDFTNQKLYWCSSDGENSIIEKVNLDGNERTIVLTTVNYGYFKDLKVDSTHQKMYWYDEYYYKILRSNLDGTNLETFLDINFGKMVIDEANSKLYFSNIDNGDISIESINLDGSSRTFLVGGFFVWSVDALALDKINNKIYYWDGANNEIKRVNTDGTGNEVWRNNMQDIGSLNIPDALPTSISSNPSAATICAGGNTSFSITASNATGYQWQVNSGSGFTDISDGGAYSDATTATLTITEATSEMNGSTYRCIASANSFPDATSESASLTVSENITYYEDFDGDGYGNGMVTTDSCTGAPEGFVSNFSDCDDDNPNTYPGAVEICDDWSDNNCDGNVDECVLAIITHPAHEVTVCLGEDDSFSVTASGAEFYQWQVNDGFGYTDIGNGDLYSGVDTATLTIITPSMEMNGYVYRCIVRGGGDTATSDPGLLFIKTTMVFTGQPYPAEWCLGEVATYTCYAISATNYQWQVNDGAGFTNLEDEDVSEGGHYSDVHTRELSIYNLNTSMEGFTYRCVASNECASDVISDHAALTILDSENAVYYEDADGDGYGNPDSSISYCYLPEGYVLNADDCNDYEATVYPGAEEICGDGLDNNCDGNIDEDCASCQTNAIWTGSFWIQTEPLADSNVIFAGDYTSTGNFEACSIQVINNAVVTFASGHNLIVAESVIVDPTAQLVFSNGANLLQHPLTTTNENTGSITFHKDSNALYNLDYTLWSSPTSGTQTLKNFSPDTVDASFFVYNTALSAYSNYLSQSGIFGSNPNAVTFTSGKGYLVRMPAGLPAEATSVFNGVFEGTPNNGDISIPLSNQGGRFNAVGNPYPSPISIRDFIDANQAQMDNGTLYFWRKKNLAATATYVTVTNMGSAAVDEPSDSSGSFTGDPSDWVIQPGQGFLFKASTTANELSFNNAMRRPSSIGPFFRSGATTMDATDNQLSRIWLDISNSSTSFGQAVIGYSANTTNGLDFGWDGRLYNDSDLSIYTKADATKLAIQARASFTENDAVPLSYKANNAGILTLKMSNYDGLFAGNQQVYLKDNVFNIYHDLKVGDYTFSSEEGTFEDRFEVVYMNATLGTENPIFDANNVIIYREGNTLKIDAGKVSMKQVDIFDIRGRLLYSVADVNATTLAISDLMVEQQVLIVQITSESNTRTSKKIIY